MHQRLPVPVSELQIIDVVPAQPPAVRRARTVAVQQQPRHTVSRAGQLARPHRRGDRPVQCGRVAIQQPQLPQRVHQLRPGLAATGVAGLQVPDRRRQQVGPTNQVHRVARELVSFQGCESNDQADVGQIGRVARRGQQGADPGEQPIHLRQGPDDVDAGHVPNQPVPLPAELPHHRPGPGPFGAVERRRHVQCGEPAHRLVIVHDRALPAPPLRIPQTESKKPPHAMGMPRRTGDAAPQQIDAPVEGALVTFPFVPLQPGKPEPATELEPLGRVRRVYHLISQVIDTFQRFL